MSKIQLNSKHNYLNFHYLKDKHERTNAPVLKTGLSNLDNNLNIRNGVYLIGGLPSIGKTSFILQLADTFAQQGNDVLFFSLEQSEYDLTEKSLNRIKHIYSIDEKESIEKYNSFAHRIKTATSNNSITIDDLCDVVKELITKYQIKPIVFIDYLQLLHTSKRLQKREEIEEVSHQIINLSKEFGLTVFVLSSLSRANYLSPIDLESFKESGSLEYDADVVLGIQYQIIRDNNFINTSSVDKKRIIIAREKTKSTRQIELVCIKNRFGELFDSCKLEYIPAKDLFREPITKEDKKAKVI